MKKSFVALAVSIACIVVQFANAQMSTTSKTKFPVYGELGLGFGQTLFFGDMKAQLTQSYGGSFNPGVGNNLMMGFYISPVHWKGLGIGSRIKGTFGTSVKGDNDDSYIFNYYNLAVSAKYYAISGQFNKGIYVRGSFGFGQFTTKRVNEASNLYKHQYAIGTSLMGGVGYTIPFKKIALSVETEFDYSNRNGTIDGKGDAGYKSGQIGGNVILSF
ncbi:hypothetical protein [Lacibacter sp. H407]|uniref:hypothetical protein n=1 Tax=Lacibacter sp. H407 TaxID=3133423 RepID=UPI0030BE0C24